MGDAGERRQRRKYRERRGVRKGGQHTRKQDVRTLKKLKALHFLGLHKSHYFPCIASADKVKYHCILYQSAEQYKGI